MNGSTGPLVVACLRHSDPRPEVDPLTGAVRRSGHGAGPAPAELAALELALRLAGTWHGQALAIVAGPPAADETLRDALAAGAAALRVDWPEPEYLAGLAADERALAAALATAIRTSSAPPADSTPTDSTPTEPIPAGPTPTGPTGPTDSSSPTGPLPPAGTPQLGRLGLVLCGDRSADRGTGALPAFLAHELGVPQALGLVELDLETLTGERRLPGGRRERLAIGRPAVCSVEAAGIRLRRAPLEAVLASRRAVILVAGVTGGSPLRIRAGAARPYRPRPHQVPPAPEGSARERLSALSGVLVTREPPALIGPATPAEAARALLDYLHRAGYAQDTPAQDSATQAGATRDGATRDSAIQDSAIQTSATQDGP
jgi:electron transfer flavoprotein beta subunit